MEITVCSIDPFVVFGMVSKKNKRRILIKIKSHSHQCCRSFQIHPHYIH